MKVYLYEKSGQLEEAVRRLAKGFTVPNGTLQIYFVEPGLSLEQAIDKHAIGAVVSPGNSYGFMDGGIDRAISEYYAAKVPGFDLSKALQNHLREQSMTKALIYNPPTSAAVLDCKLGKVGPGGRELPVLIHCPTMSTPHTIREGDPVVFNCVWNSIIAFSDIARLRESILIPALGTGYGQVSIDSCAAQISAAILVYLSDQYVDVPPTKDWETTLEFDRAIQALAYKDPTPLPRKFVPSLAPSRLMDGDFVPIVACSQERSTYGPPF